MTRLMKRLVISLLCAVAGASASAASFDCARARQPVEKMICNDAVLSQRDTELGAAYAAFQRAHAGAPLETGVQRSWLAVRDACPDAACIARAYTTRIAELRVRSASTSPLAGYWKIVYSCAEATGIYEDRCKEGLRDVFALSIVVEGNRICISHMATAQLGNRVDENEGPTPSMTGTIDAAGNATVHYVSAWEGTGTATLHVDGGVLHWQVKDQGGQSWIPRQETLPRVPAGPNSWLPTCGGMQ